MKNVYWLALVIALAAATRAADTKGTAEDEAAIRKTITAEVDSSNAKDGIFESWVARRRSPHNAGFPPTVKCGKRAAAARVWEANREWAAVIPC